jgi:hypothetical protein
MIESENSIISTPISWCKFWLPFEKIIIPVAPQGHYYVPLRENAFSAHYENNLSAFQALSELINTNSFTSVTKNASFALKSPYFKYSFVRILLFIFFIIYSLDFISSLLGGNLFGVIIYSILLVLCPILMRRGANQYLIRMRKYEKVMKKCCLGLSNTLLAGSGVVVEPGRYCKWLDFHTGGYSPPPAPAPFVQNPAYYFPGTQVIYT